MIAPVSFRRAHQVVVTDMATGAPVRAQVHASFPSGDGGSPADLMLYFEANVPALGVRTYDEYLYI
jgi:hypothetical protein